MPNEDYADFIIADNDVADATEEVANPQIDGEEIETETEVTAEPTEQVETEKAKELTETQRVSQRINEAKQQARDEVYANMEIIWNNKPITTEAQYNQALAEQKQLQEEEAQREKYQASDLPEEVINELLESRREREERKAEKVERAKQEAINNDNRTFLEYFAKENGRQFDNTKDVISEEVWQEVRQGKSLVDAYTRQEAKELKAKLKVYTQNETNKKKAPMSQGIATHGSDEVAIEDDFMAGFNSIH